MGSSYGEWATRFRVPLGFALGIACLVLAQPAPTSLASGAGVALGGLTLRAWAAGCLEKGQRLATGGPYAYTRNPLYLGSLLIGTGFALASRSWPLAIGFAALLLLVYWPVIQREDAFLRGRFGESYDRYAARVPLLLPLRLGRLHRETPGEGFRWVLYKKNREYEAALGYAAGVGLLIVKMKLR